ncbi:MAG: UDP-N-acetylenolpyruvoylglucosamine reductase, partial [Candidatus Anoxychlamydiales bacterium]|nr:UDP-N-acetylenolpyruvoylglucosamine reductase [Candidatus Anoxychlamydiales bacterium]
MKILKNKSLKEFTTFKIGGKASNFFEAKTFDDMKKIYVFAKENNLK